MSLTGNIDELLKRGKRSKRVQITLSAEEMRLIAKGARISKSKIASFIRAAAIVGAAAYVQSMEKPNAGSD